MKVLLLVLIASTFTYSKMNQLKDYADELEFETKPNGKCKYSRNQLNKAQLNNIYNTKLNTSVKKKYPQYINRNFNCIFIQRNLDRDSNKIKISPKKVFSNKEDGYKEINGKIKYVGLVNRKYKYSIKKNKGKTYIQIKIALKNRFEVPKEDIVELKRKLKTAERIWNYGGQGLISFNFILVKNNDFADFEVSYNPKYSRGPYDTEWSSKWSAKTIAHEMGHMLGLDDEYDNILVSTVSGLSAFLIRDKNEIGIKKKTCTEYSDPKDIELMNYFQRLNFGSDRASKCDKSSIMCDSYKGSPKKWHIYTILKRFHL